MQGDALQVIQLINYKATKWSEAGLVVQDAVSVLDSFASWSVGHINCDANSVAHILVKAALSLGEDLVELECIPLCINNLAISNDVILK